MSDKFSFLGWRTCSDVPINVSLTANGSMGTMVGQNVQNYLGYQVWRSSANPAILQGIFDVSRKINFLYLGGFNDYQSGRVRLVLASDANFENRVLDRTWKLYSPTIGLGAGYLGGYGLGGYLDNLDWFSYQFLMVFDDVFAKYWKLVFTYSTEFFQLTRVRVGEGVKLNNLQFGSQLILADNSVQQQTLGGGFYGYGSHSWREVSFSLADLTAQQEMELAILLRMVGKHKDVVFVPVTQIEQHDQNGVLHLVNGLITDHSGLSRSSLLFRDMSLSIRECL